MTLRRVGGDEFTLVLPDTDARGAHQVVSEIASKLREALAAGNWQVTCSIGVVTILDSAVSPESVVGAADKVMYQVKAKGKDAIEFSVLDEAVRLNNALDRRQLASPTAARR